MQALSYYYDPVGNVTGIRDDADTQNAIFFRNQRVEPSASYTYDAIYQLLVATGREHLGQTSGALAPPAQVTHDDSPRTGLPQPGDGTAMATYTENYGYDAAGNLTSVGHVVTPGSWTRRYACTEPSRITAAETGNRLTATSLPGDPVAGPYTGTYAHDEHGNMTRMPHLSALTWDEADQLRSTTPNAGGTPQITWYAYDGAGHRARKVTDQPGTTVRKTERIYLGAVEIYRKYAADGTTITLSRETLHVTDGGQAVALVEHRTTGTDKGPAALVRYQHANHLGSALLELDDAANIITYEEYFPYGATSYQAVTSQTEAPKRYRYTGKERDEETGLYYIGARYYAPWLGRWTACDPAGLVDGLNLYAYVRGNPACYHDPAGFQTAADPSTNAQMNRAWIIQHGGVGSHGRDPGRGHSHAGHGGGHGASDHAHHAAPHPAHHGAPAPAHHGGGHGAPGSAGHGGGHGTPGSAGHGGGGGAPGPASPGGGTGTGGGSGHGGGTGTGGGSGHGGGTGTGGGSGHGGGTGTGNGSGSGSKDGWGWLPEILADALLVITLAIAAVTVVGFVVEFSAAITAGLTLSEAATVATGATITGIGTTGLGAAATTEVEDAEETGAVGEEALTVEAGATESATSAYDEALAGGKHAGFLRNYLDKPTPQIERGITSIEKQIAEHQAKIQNPSAYIDDWASLDPRQQQALLNSKWPGDIARQQEQLEILRGILGSR